MTDQNQRRNHRATPPVSCASYRGICAAAIVALAAGGCSTPFQPRPAERLSNLVLDTARDRVAAETPEAPSPRPMVRDDSDQLDLSTEQVQQLGRLGGPDSYADTALAGLGLDLLDRAGLPPILVELDEAAASAVEHNLDTRRARFEPAINAQATLEALAAFDWALIADGRWQVDDSPSISGFGPSTAGNEAQSLAYSVGVTKRLQTGGRFTATTGQTYTDITAEGSGFLEPDPSNRANITARLEQPLLRGFGRDVNLAEVRISENLTASAVEDLRRTLLDTLLETERAYWDLYTAEQSLRIRYRLLERGRETRERIRGRLRVDAIPADLYDAIARVEQRRGEIIRAANTLRQASDRLKRVVNDPEIPLTSEALLLASRAPADTPLTFDFADQLLRAIAERPETRRALLAIDNAGIRAVVADNARLARLDLTAGITAEGFDESIADAYQDVFETQYLNWAVGLNFERSISNREADAAFRRARLERLAAATDYTRVVQSVTSDVKTALRNVETAYELIEQSRVTRLAATENLRSFEVRLENIERLTPANLNLLFNRQEALAQAELEEVNALAAYQLSIAELRAATGALLEERGVRIVAPDAAELLEDDPLDGERPLGW